MFYLTIALNSFYFWLYGVRHMEKDHSATCSCDHMPTLFDWQQELFYMHHPTDRIEHTMAFVTPVVEHWLEREVAQWVHHEGSV